MDDISQSEVPGTIFIVGTDTSKLGEPDATTSNNIVLVPRPLETARDPLNWPKRKKLWTLFLATLFATVVAYGENNLGAPWTEVAEDIGVSMKDMNGGSALNYLLLGFVNVLWIPTAMKLGRKIVYISSMTIIMLTSVWNAYLHGVVQWYLNSLVGGIGQSAYQALIQLTVFDVFFAHQRGTMLAVYVWGQQLGSILALILGGYIAEGPGWRWSCKIVAILSGTVVLLFIFTMDDSLFPRHALARSTSTHSTISQATPNAQQTGDDTKKEPFTDLTREPTLAQGRTDLLPRNYLHVLSPIHRWKEDKTTWWQYFRRPFHLFAFPNIIMAGLIYAFANTAGIVSFNTISEIMTDDPYNWSTGPTGLMFLAALVGSFIGMATGALSDYLTLHLARKNNGYKEPEMRLWTLAPAFVYGAVGYFMYGWAASEGNSWVLIAVGLGAMIAQQVSAASVATAYAMECFEGISSELVVVLAICSSLVNFAISYSVQPFIEATDYGRTFTCFGALVLASMAMAGVGVRYGKSWRRYCAGRYWRFVEEGVAIGAS
ncbi:major facilitator superfamily domain-containing protein [Aspergillus pseudodeflectus]|uniref:Major facilitator superfamily domain-containing protein n=1 Tax=Aspergillus pseudodeflectus TaxID=176178 RepID=A0ABR4L2A7_9EURO